MWITKFFCEEKTYFRGKQQSLPHFIHNLWISTYVLVCRKKAPESLNFKIKKDTMKETRFETYVIGGILCQKKLKSVLSDMEI